MARKITTIAIESFLSGKVFNKQNSSVEIREFKLEGKLSAVLKLHGKVIARRLLDGSLLEICDGNYQSDITKERLNGIPGVSIQQKKGVWFLNGVEWDGGWTKIS